MLGHSLFKFVSGQYEDVGYCVTSNDLQLNNVDDETGTLLPGHVVGFPSWPTKEIELAGPKDAFGFLKQYVNAYGTVSDEGYKEFREGYKDIPVKRGNPVGVRKMLPGALIEVETAGAATTDNLADKTSIDAAAVNSLLTLGDGTWVPAVATNFAYGILRNKTLTPETAGNSRYLIEIISPFLVA